ncbi:P-loop NTPase family protein [Microlunatus parietis]|uniref:Adenylate kinase family enzyme n=1 Tax=Microlunatus parietis TaxID=682979 RepID=A0A7Y9I5K7_9ACTN|nr:adenylate kinase [Microlunatus parietis]NYE70508.1 adenylate kinase family enzyme [Microlunatus parietis]
MINEDGTPVRRILVYGVTGSGKTTLARRLGERIGLPWHAVDDLTWDRPWVPVPKDEQRRRIAAICAGDAWILDHGYGAGLDVVLERVEVIIALDYPRLLSLGRLIRRCLVNVIKKVPTCNGNIETWRTMLRRDSIIWWHFKSCGPKSARIRGWAADPEGPRVIVFRRPAEAERWLSDLERDNVA